MKPFTSSMTAKLRQLPDESEDIEKEWLQLRSGIIALAVKCCAQMRLRVAGDSKKRTPGGTKMSEQLFEQRNMHMLQNRSSPDFNS